MLLYPTKTVSITATTATSDLDALERRLLSADPESSPLDADLDLSAPDADAAALARSTFELRLLSQVLRGPSRASAPPIPAELKNARAGYLLREERGTLVAFPLLLTMLARAFQGGEIAPTPFEDLWRVDWQVAAQLHRQDRPEVIARSWLRSPGRRLLRDLSLLVTPLGQGPGATDWSWARILQAAGLAGETTDSMGRFLPAWRQLHHAIPGALLSTWQPERDDPVTVLDLLEDAIPLCVRAAALLWLENRAMDNPLFPVSGEELDLRNELKVPLETSLSTARVDTHADPSAMRLSTLVRNPQAVRWQYEHSYVLETSALLHAALLAAQPPLDDPEDQRADRGPRAIWGVARWLLTCLLHSPFLGMSETQLALRLRAALPRPLPLPADSDVLHPARFRDDGSGLDVAEVALLNAVYVHQARPGQPVMAPQGVLLTGLREIARRALNPGELLAEEQLAQSTVHADGSRGDLRWSAPHVAPPLLARYLLCARKEAWLSLLSPEAMEQQWGLLRVAPDRFLPWLSLALAAELHRHPAQQDRALVLWRELSEKTQQPTVAAAQRHYLAIFAVGFLEKLDDLVDTQALLAQAECAPQGERPQVLDLIARSAAQRHLPALWGDALRRLQALVQDAAALPQARLGAAVALVQRVAAADAPLDEKARAAQLAWIQKNLNQSPFLDHLGLRRALRSFGILR